MLKPLYRILATTLLFGAVLSQAAPSSAAPALASRTCDEASVRVVVTPKAIGREVKVWEFTVVMDTHVKPLNDNLTQAAVLIDSTGRRTQPAAWQGDVPGGHHRKGILQFSAPAEMPKSVELQLGGVGGVAMRTFQWEVK